jgi:hypothetical protein
VRLAPKSGQNFRTFVLYAEPMSRPNAILARGAVRWAVFLVVAMTMAQPVFSAEPLHRVFASCVGRLSAEMEHQWLMKDRDADATQVQRSRMITLGEAVTPVGLEPQVLHLRIQAKYAHKALLSRATFNNDPTDARWAAAQARSELSRCTGLLLN